MRRIVTLKRVLKAAAELNTGGSNPEYTRAQAELICDAFALPMDTFRDQIWALLMRGTR